MSRYIDADILAEFVKEEFDGLVVYDVAPDTACMFCKHCDEIIYDFTNGPYLFGCVVGGDTDKAFDKDVRCELFESEE